MPDPMIEKLDLAVEPGDQVTDLILVAVTQRLDSFGQSVYIATTPHTGYVTTIGALTAALEHVGCCGEDPDDDD